VQVIGKDILRFHAAIWPGMLLGLGLALTKILYVHGFVTLNGEKMSKSTGNVVDPKEIIDAYGVDAFRYYFLRHIPSYDDGDFTWEHFEHAYNDELGNELGNAVQRVAAMLKRYQNGIIGTIPEPNHDNAQYYEALEQCHFDRALDEVWEQVRGLNQYIEEQKPWAIAKEKDDAEHLREVLAYCAGSLIEISDLLTPFLPATARKIREAFEEGFVRETADVLFPRIELHSDKASKPVTKTVEKPKK